MFVYLKNLNYLKILFFIYYNLINKNICLIKNIFVYFLLKSRIKDIYKIFTITIWKKPKNIDLTSIIL